jgi:hypothetical protein
VGKIGDRSSKYQSLYRGNAIGCLTREMLTCEPSNSVLFFFLAYTTHSTSCSRVIIRSVPTN